MAYGQTGSGKTYTIFGINDSIDYQESITEDMGIIPRSIKQIYNYINEVKFLYLESRKDRISSKSSFYASLYGTNF